MKIRHSRNNCLVSGNEDLQTVKKINNFPIVMGCSSQGEKSDLLEDLIFSISKSTGFIQIKNLIDPTLLYSAINEYHGAGSVGSMWQRHHEEFSRFINLNNPSSIFEIGGGHGILSKIFEQKYKLIDWTIIEPYPRPVEGVKAKFIKGFFDEHFKSNLKYDLIVHSHTLEHIYDPKSFLIQLNSALKHGQI
ncbi:class I SAM-dependent methyltransferase, partial [Flavobacteriaceae bacterium]|nr:class I SAM-dependent methyltransferase [Flavobacteriaceae bacterium]